MLKTVALLNFIFVDTVILWWIESAKAQQLFDLEIF